MTDINNYEPTTGRIIAEDGKTANVVDLLGGGTAVGTQTYNINQYAPRTGRVIGEDGKLYNIVELLGNVGSSVTTPTIITAAETTATIPPNTVYEYGEVSELNLTLSDDIGSYEGVFESGETPTVLSITSTKQLLWHNEPTVLASKVYTLAIEVGTTYARAVLSYAE